MPGLEAELSIDEDLGNSRHSFSIPHYMMQVKVPHESYIIKKMHDCMNDSEKRAFNETIQTDIVHFSSQ